MSDSPRASDHEVFDELAVGWALHALEPEDETFFARHLPDCTRCARTVAETEEVMAALATDLPPAEPSEQLRSRLRAAVERTEQVRRPPAVPAPFPETSAPLRTRRRSDAGAGPRAAQPGTPEPGGPAEPPGRGAWMRERGWTLAMAAAVAAVVGLGIWNVSLSTDRDRAVDAAARQQAVVEELLQPGARVLAQLDGESGPVAAVVAREDALQVVSQALPVNDDTDETYVLWGLRDGEPKPVAVGVFDVHRSRLDVDAVRSAATGSRDFDAYAVSLEPGRQPPAAPSEVLASGQVTS